MDNLTTLSPLWMNVTDDDLNIIDDDETDTPKSVGISRYPPGYFVIPAAMMVRYRLVVYGGLIPVVALIGLVGNVISFKVLLRHVMPKTTKMLLLAITVADFFNLLTAMLFCWIGLSNALKFKPGSNAAFRAYPIFGSYLMLVFGRISSLLIVVIALERLCAVYFPFKIKTICSKNIVSGGIFACVLISALIFIPNALEYRPLDITSPNSSDVTTILLQTDLGKNRPFYKALYTANMVVMRIFPVFIVLICNIAISISLFRSRSARSDMTGQKVDQASAERRITKTLLGLAILYLICMLPNSIVIIVQVFDTERPFPFSRTNVYNFFSLFFYWTEVINSSANFVVYMCSSKQMRTEFIRAASCGLYDSSAKGKQSGSENHDLGSSKATSVATVSEFGGL